MEAFGLDSLEYIPTRKIGYIHVPVLEDQVVRLECSVRNIVSPFLELELLSEQVPLANIDPTGACVLHFETFEEVVCLIAGIDEVLDDQHLRLESLEAAIRPQKRRYFRVNAEVPVDLQIPTIAPVHAMVGESINLSACGILVAFPQPLKYQRRVWMELYLPGNIDRYIRCIAQVVRLDLKKEEKYLSGFNFEKMRPEDQEVLVAYCLARQRQELRLRVKVFGR
ncbi:MAG: hypothetical protein A2521_16785 [Deltaproteobacteria bacterium RIFOXYD12_FULL_57_12]|nr:MAG: hypothetical protein A2521_16785 [Deltaproteobacteria bacterium RIFOXYD12_FULL_57_12]